MLGVGTGENLNEHIFGDHWPPGATRRAMLEEAVALGSTRSGQSRRVFSSSTPARSYPSSINSCPTVS
jgi:hypothetical protein